MSNVREITHCPKCKTLGNKVLVNGYVISCVCPKCGNAWSTIATKKVGASA